MKHTNSDLFSCTNCAYCRDFNILNTCTCNMAGKRVNAYGDCKWNCKCTLEIDEPEIELPFVVAFAAEPNDEYREIASFEALMDAVYFMNCEIKGFGFNEKMCVSDKYTGEVHLDYRNGSTKHISHTLLDILVRK